MSTPIIDAAALAAVAGVFGGMVFFAFVFAPLVFVKLGTETGGRFIREVFPVYYVAMGATSITAAVLLIFASAMRGIDALAMACIGIVFLLARFVLLPIINRNRDAGQAGNLAAKKRFRCAAPCERHRESGANAGGAGGTRAVRSALTPKHTRPYRRHLLANAIPP